MSSSLATSWAGRLKSFVFALDGHSRGDTTGKGKAYERAYREFSAFVKEWDDTGEAVYTRENIKWMGDTWRALCMQYGQERMLEEFPEWSFIVTQFQLLVLLSELRP